MKNIEKMITGKFLKRSINIIGYPLSYRIIMKLLVPRILNRQTIRELESTVEKNRAACFPQPVVNFTADSCLEYIKDKIAADIIFTNFSFLRSRDFILHSARVEGKEYFLQALEKNAGIILLGAHFGSVIHGIITALVLCLESGQGNTRGYRICSEPGLLKIESVITILQAIGNFYKAGLEYIDTGQGTFSIISAIIKALQSGYIVTTNMDVAAGGGNSRLQAPFLSGKKVRLPALNAAVMCAFKTGATILPWYNIKDAKGKFLFTFAPPLIYANHGYECRGNRFGTKQELAEKLTNLLAQWITRYPDQWIYWDRVERLLVC